MKLNELSAVYDWSVALNETRSKANDERQAKRQGEMQDALTSLSAMSGSAETAKQNLMNKVGMLKQRLEALKAMLLHASPRQARALAHELKSIAGELASLAKNVTGGTAAGVSLQVGAGAATGAPAAGSNPPAAASPAGGDAEPAAETAPSAAVPAAANGSDGDQHSDKQAKAGSAVSERTGASRSAAQKGGDEDLRAALQDAKKLLKETIALLKAKLALAANEAKASKEEKQAKRDLQSADRSLDDMDKALSSVTGADFYTAQGEPGAGDGVGSLPDSVTASGLNVNVTV